MVTAGQNTGKPILIYSLRVPNSTLYTSIQFRSDPSKPGHVDMIYNHSGGEVETIQLTREEGRTQWKNMVNVGFVVDPDVEVAYPSV